MQVVKLKCFLCGHKGDVYKIEDKPFHIECWKRYDEFKGIRESELVNKEGRLIFKQVKYATRT